jgi:tetratricopeptide (TPR) repeat protein
MSVAADLRRARTLIELERYGPARDLLSRVVGQEPGHGEALCLLGQACLAMKDYSGARQAADAAIRQLPDSEWPLRIASLATAHLGDVEQAHSMADAAIRISPDQWMTHTNRASVDLVLHKVDDESLAAAWKGRELAPHEARAHRVVGSVFLELRRVESAEAAIREALRLDPNDAAARNELARVHLRSRKLGHAASGFADAAALNPRDTVAANNLVVVGARALRIVHLILWVVLFTAGRVAIQSDRHPNRAAAVFGWVVAAVAIGVAASRLGAGTGGHRRTVRLLRIVLRRDRLLTAWAVCLGLAFAGLTAAVFAPTRALVTCVGVSGLALFVGVIFSWVRAGRLKRRGR